MIAAVFSDSHGERARLQRGIDAALERRPQGYDVALHLGDGAADAQMLKALAPQVYALRGNCDFDMKAPLLLELEWEGAKVLAAHGHAYRVKSGLALLVDDARQRDCSAALFGHTHRPLVQYEQGILLFNPGSVGHPAGNRATFGVVEVRGGEVCAEVIEM